MMPKSLNDWISAVAAAFGIVATVISSYVAFQSHALKEKADTQAISIAALDAELKKSAEARAAMQSQQAHYIAIYEKVYAALQADNERQQLAAAALLQTLPPSDYKTRLGELFNSPIVKSKDAREIGRTVAEQSRFSVETAAAGGSPNQWDYDIFWCADTPDNRDLAEKIQRSITAPGQRYGRVRVRVLPDSVNATSGYRVTDNVIRAEARERGEAETLRQRVSQVAETDFAVMTSGSSTPWYLSVFVCRGSKP